MFYDPWSNLHYEPEPPAQVDPNLLWFNSNVNPDDVLEASEHRSQFEYTVDGKKRRKPGTRHTTVGYKAEVNGVAVAIFKNFGRLYAINDRCPHQGGALHLGDIEEIDKILCVSCPRHHWPFSLKDGRTFIGTRFQAEVYPVEIRSDDGRDVLFIGFPAFTSTLFHGDEF